MRRSRPSVHLNPYQRRAYLDRQDRFERNLERNRLIREQLERERAEASPMLPGIEPDPLPPAA